MPMSPRLLRPIASGVHPEAAAWQNSVIANGDTVSGSTLRAVSQFCRSIDAAGIRDRLWRVNLFAGTGLGACLVPLYRGPSRTGTQYGNTTDTNNGPFVSGDYTETGASGGLVGNGSTKFIDTGLAMTALPDGLHAAAWIVNSTTVAGQRSGADNFNDSGFYTFGLFRSAAGGAVMRAMTADVVAGAGVEYSSGKFWLGVTFKGGGTSGVYRDSALLNSATTFSRTITGESVYVFAGNRKGSATSFTSDRIGMYSFGDSMTAGQVLSYYNAANAFMAAMGRV